MAKSTVRTFRGVVEDQPLTPAQRRLLVEKPFPTLGIYAGKSWGGLAKREGLLSPHGAHTWTGRYSEGDCDVDI